MKSIVLGFTLVALSACAGQPSQAPTPAATAASQPAQPGPAVTAQKILAMKRLGYTIKNQDGDVLFCQEEKQTGTRIRKELVCMTEKQIDDLRELTQRRMENTSRQIVPLPGK